MPWHVAIVAGAMLAGCAAWVPEPDTHLFEDPAEAGLVQASWDAAACEPVPLRGISGIRDVAVDRANGWLLIAANEPGIWGLPMDALGSDAVEPVRLSSDTGATGLGLLSSESVDAAGPQCGGAPAPVLYTVGAGDVDEVGSRVARYAWCAPDRRLTPLSDTAPLADPEGMLTRARDIHPVGPDQFFVTNGPGLEPDALNRGAELIRLATASVVYFDGGTYREAVDGLRMAGGVTADRFFLYVTEPGNGYLWIYRLPELGADALPLKALGVIRFGNTVDRVAWVGEPGYELYIGAPPVSVDFGPGWRGWQDSGPTGVLRLRWREDGAPAISVVLDDPDRTLLAEPRVAVPIAAGPGRTRGTAMVVGSPSDANLVYCPAAEEGASG